MRPREFHPESVESILVIRLYFVGDVLLTTPVLEALKRRFPDARLTVLVKRRAAAVLEGNPFVDEVMVYDAVPRYHSPKWAWRLASELRGRRFSLAVDLTGDLRSSWLLLASDPAFRVGVNHAGCGFLLDRRIDYVAKGHVVDHLLSAVEPLGAAIAGVAPGDPALAGPRPGNPAPAMYLSARERQRALGILEEAGVEREAAFLALSPGANWEFRRWRPERFGALASAARDRFGVTSVVVGSETDENLAGKAVAASEGAAVSLAGRTSLRELAAVIERARAFVGNDSGPAHVAAAVGAPVVALFGPNTPERFAPRGPRVRVVWKRFPCCPCRQRDCVRPGDTCMDAIGVEEVLAELGALISQEDAG